MMFPFSFSISNLDFSTPQLIGVLAVIGLLLFTAICTNEAKNVDNFAFVISATVHGFCVALELVIGFIGFLVLVQWYEHPETGAKDEPFTLILALMLANVEIARRNISDVDEQALVELEASRAAAEAERQRAIADYVEPKSKADVIDEFMDE